ncbi:MAG: hypothetical protein JKY57_06170 [Kordiimonadaceae bacterium]|nr:hypothetical protein [Kordiimonadaceae bacterium]
MIESVSTAPSLAIKPVRATTPQINSGQKKLNVDLDTVAKSTVRISPTGSAGFGKGLRLDIKA